MKNKKPTGMRCSKMKEACGIFGIFAPGQDLLRLTNYALYALQHRGQESAGIAISDGHNIHLKRKQDWFPKSFPILRA